MSWSLDEAAARMGMPVHEILAVAEVDDCHVVTTHDGQRTLVTDAGATEPYTAPAPAPVLDPVDDEGQDDGGTGDGGGDGVPDGSAKDVLAWVGDDKERAAAALATEQARAEPRSTLVGALQKLLAE